MIPHICHVTLTCGTSRMSCDPHKGVLLDAQPVCALVHPAHPAWHTLLEVVHRPGTRLHPGEDSALQVGQTGTLRQDLHSGGNTAAFKGLCMLFSACLSYQSVRRASFLSVCHQY